MKIRSIRKGDEHAIRMAAQLLVEGFEHFSPHPWPTLTDALDEVRQSLAVDRISLLATTGDGKPLGFIGGIRQYDGHVVELHPLVVSRAARRQGVGTALVQELEKHAKEMGASTIYLGSDDVNGDTTLDGVDVYPDPLRHLIEVKNRKEHPMDFYQSCGYVVVGMLPDANGFGKPDIFMAKRI